jgi:putative oxidoreductase
MRYALLAGRLLFSVIFVIAAAGHFSAETIEYAARQGVPMADLLVPISGTVALMGGLSVMVGFQTRLGAASLVVFLIPVTFEMHKFWIAPDTTAFLIEKAMFMKNLSMLGGALIISYFGAGPLSLDAFVEGERPLIEVTSVRAHQPTVNQRTHE